MSTGSTDTQSPRTASVPSAQLYEAPARVIDDRLGGHLLCLDRFENAQVPPPCGEGDVPLANWDWDAVEGEQTADGVTWGRYHVVGTYDDGIFTLVAAGPPQPSYGEPLRITDFSPPCPDPAGGWVDVEPAKASENDFYKGASRAEALSDFVALWVAYVGNPSPEELTELEERGLPQTIMNVVVAEDRGRAESTIREVWGGPLCVLEREGPTEKQLRSIRDEAERWLVEELGLPIISSDPGRLGVSAAEITIPIDPGGAAQAELDERYGPGMVTLIPALTPVES